MKKEILFKNKWMNVVKLDDWYVCTDDVRTKDNNFVCVLPYMTVRGRKLKYLLRMEKNPAHHPTDLLLSAITGQCETSSVRHHARQELKEEGGYSIPIDRLNYLGNCRPSKASMGKIHLYAAPIYRTDIPHAANGDGTRGEQGCYPVWHERTEVIGCKDAYLQTCLVRLEDWLYNKERREYYRGLEK